MRTPNTNLLLLLALTLFEIQVATAFHVYVTNGFVDDPDLILPVPCRSKEADLGTRFLAFGAAFDWDFDIRIDHAAEYWCNMTWARTHGDFQVFDEPRDAVRCSYQECYWSVNRDGLSLYIESDGYYELQFRWP